MDTPLPPKLSPSNIGSFAYLTVKDRLPVILTRVIDYLYRERTTLKSRYGEEAQECCKEAVGHLSQMKNEMQTNKNLQLLEPQPNNPYDDSALWNSQYESYVELNGVPPKWFASPWLYVECHMYARIHEALYHCNAIREFDPFEEQKEKSLEDSMPTIEVMTRRLLSICSSLSSQTQDQLKQQVVEFFEVSLWGNRCDLSITAGADYCQDEDSVLSLEKLRSKIIVNDFDMLWQFLISLPEDQRDIVLVLDNAGLELVSDLCLMTLLMEAGLMTSLTLHTKTRPWFVSDVMEKDLRWTVDKLRSNSSSVGQIASKWSGYLSDGRWKVCNNKFWTTGFDYYEMSKIDPDLYAQLSQASLVVFKGDLNYRKLTGDLDWPSETPFERAIQNFRPTSLIAVRTNKGGPAVGLLPDQSTVLSNEDRDWSTNGNYGMIQFCSLS